MRDTPSKKNQKFVEFYDVRDAAKALKQMNGKEIDGKKVVIEFSRPGGHHSRKLFHSAASNKKPLNSNVPPLSPSPPFYASTPQVPRKYSRRFGSSCSHSSSSPQVPFKKCGSVEAALGSIGLGGGEVGNGVEEQQHHSDGTQKRNSVRKESGEHAEGSAKQQQQLVRSRHWKGKQARKHETRFLIRDDDIVESSSRDPRTTVMIKNIPNKYRYVFDFFFFF